MTPRQARRVAERSKNKQARKAGSFAEIATPEELTLTDESVREEPTFEEQTDEQPLVVPNQEHLFCPGHSTGPRTPEGKARSAMNNLRHGLTGAFYVLPNESPEKFEALQAALIEEHAPTTPTEMILVEKMAEHLWLSRRAQRMQEGALSRDDVKSLMLFLRYQTTNDRAFYRATAELRSMRKQALQFESQNATVRLVNARAHHFEQDTEIRGRIEAPLPGNAAIPFDIAKRFIGSSLKQAHDQYTEFAARTNRR